MDTDGIMSLFNEHGNAIYNFCLYLAKNKHDGEDLLQQTFMRAIEISSKIDKHNNPKSYLCSIAVNIWNNTVSKRTRHSRITKSTDFYNTETHLIEDKDVNVENGVIDKIVKDTLLEVVNLLDDKYRIPIILSYMEDMKISEISVVLCKPEGTVKRRIHEAKNKIKKEMEARGYDYR